MCPVLLILHRNSLDATKLLHSKTREHCGMLSIYPSRTLLCPLNCALCPGRITFNKCIIRVPCPLASSKGKHWQEARECKHSEVRPVFPDTQLQVCYRQPALLRKALAPLFMTQMLSLILLTAASPYLFQLRDINHSGRIHQACDFPLTFTP